MIIGVGIDLVEIGRVSRLVESKGDRALRRLFTDREIAYCSQRGFPASSLAARVAAKEAAFKALAGNGLARMIGWREMEVSNGPDGRPLLVLHGRAATRAAELRVEEVWLTLTHTSTTAGAFVILEGPEGDRTA
jgi:holo-[acyl-carrier protein] synthase